jgi:hypothetical protein
MTTTTHRDCEYCGRSVPFDELEFRHDRLVCKDTAACDAAGESQHREHLSGLRRRQREGDELTDAERAELSDG